MASLVGGLTLVVAGCSHQNVGVTRVQQVMSYQLSTMEADLIAFLEGGRPTPYAPNILNFEVSLDPEGLLESTPDHRPISSYFDIETNSTGATVSIVVAVSLPGDGWQGPAQSAAGYGCFTITGTFQEASVTTSDRKCPDWIHDWIDGKLDFGRYMLQNLEDIR